MAGIKKPPPPSQATSSSSSSSHRPFNTLITLTFLLISALSLWVMRIDTALNDVPADFLPQVESGYLQPSPVILSSSTSSSEQHQPLPLHLRKHYTGIAALDEVLAFLVAAFVAGPAGLDPGIRLQQVHFLVSFYAIAAVWAVEASRMRHVGRRSVTWTALYALLYQTVGAAVIIPLFCVAHLAASADGGNGGENGRERGRGRQMRPGYAVALLPATALGYLVPTLAVYAHGYWGGDLDVTQGLIAFWQPAPLLMEVLLVMFASIFALSPPRYLRRPKPKPRIAAARTTTSRTSNAYTYSQASYPRSRTSACSIRSIRRPLTRVSRFPTYFYLTGRRGMYRYKSIQTLNPERAPLSGNDPLSFLSCSLAL